MSNFSGGATELHLLLEGDWVRPSLMLALMSAGIVIGLAAYLSRTTRKSYFILWTVAWLFYSVYLLTCLRLEDSPGAKFLELVRYACVGTTALLVLWSTFHVMQRLRNWRELALGSLAVAIASYLAVYHVKQQLWVSLPLFVLLAAACGCTAVVYLRGRKWNRGSKMVAAGFVLWGLHSLSIPFLGRFPIFTAIAHVAWAVSALIIATGVVVEQEIFVSEMKYRSLFDSSKDAIFVVDLMTQQLLDMNKAARQLSGREEKTLAGTSFLDVCPELRKEQQTTSDPHKMFATVFRPYGRFGIVRANGESVVCEGEMRPAQQGHRDLLLLHIREVGQNVKVGQQIRRAEKLSSLGQLVAGVAHELNNPLAVVMGYAQLLIKRKDVDEKIRTELGKVLHEAERAAKIVRNLLAFVRPAEPQMVAVDINRVVLSVLDTRQNELTASNIRVEKKLASHLPKTKADPNQIEQVLTNLVMNAIQAMASLMRPGLLSVTTEENGFFIRIIVSDTGAGVAPEIAGQIFDPFFTTKAPGKGTGLGLTISNGIIEEHRGKIWVESEPGKGATFIIELPMLPCEEADAVVKPPRALEPDPNASQRRLLIVDDEPGIVSVLVEVLGGSGYNVETASNGSEAMNRIKSNRYDLIISDLCMPEMDGKKLYETVLDRYPDLAHRIIFVTGDTVSNNSRTFLEGTGSHWLSKPFSIREVEELVGKCLRNEDVGALAGKN